MIKTFLLGPGEFTGHAERVALQERRSLGRILSPWRHVVIMEDEPHRDGESDAEKFLRLLDSTEEIVVWLPKDGRLPTVFAELVAIRFRSEHHDKPIAIFHETGVLDTTGPELIIKLDEGKIAYLRDLRMVADIRTWEYATEPDLWRLLDHFGQGLLEDA